MDYLAPEPSRQRDRYGPPTTTPRCDRKPLCFITSASLSKKQAASILLPQPCSCQDRGEGGRDGQEGKDLSPLIDEPRKNAVVLISGIR